MLKLPAIRESDKELQVALVRLCVEARLKAWKNGVIKCDTASPLCRNGLVAILQTLPACGETSAALTNRHDQDFYSLATETFKAAREAMNCGGKKMLGGCGVDAVIALGSPIEDSPKYRRVSGRFINPERGIFSYHPSGHSVVPAWDSVPAYPSARLCWREDLSHEMHRPRFVC
jgi:hypothetical protein